MTVEEINVLKIIRDLSLNKASMEILSEAIFNIFGT